MTSERPTDPAQAWRDIVLAVARAWRVDAVADWLARQRLTIWLDAHMPKWLDKVPPWWRVWAWCAYVYSAVVVVVLVRAFLTGQLP
jgi:hypothetical protein